MIDKNTGRTLQSTTTTLRLIDSLVQREGARVSEAAADLGISKSAASNHLHTLRKEGYVVRNGDEYYPSLKFTYIGEHAKQHDQAYEIAVEVTNQLNERTPFETTFIVEENDLGRYLIPESRKSGQHDRFAFIGEREYLHTIAAGKAILSTFSRERVESVIQQWGLDSKTSNTITSEEDLFEELECIRNQGYATNQRENREEIYAIARVVRKPHGETLGAMSILTPSFRLKGDDFGKEQYQLLFEHVDELESRLERTGGDKIDM